MQETKIKRRERRRRKEYVISMGSRRIFEKLVVDPAVCRHTDRHNGQIQTTVIRSFSFVREGASRAGRKGSRAGAVTWLEWVSALPPPPSLSAPSRLLLPPYLILCPN